jgi:hypothetical protein
MIAAVVAADPSAAAVPHIEGSVAGFGSAAPGPCRFPNTIVPGTEVDPHLSDGIMYQHGWVILRHNRTAQGARVVRKF